MLAMSIRRVSAALHLLDGGRHTLAATRGSIPARTHRHHGICPVRRLRGHAARERPSAAADEVGAGRKQMQASRATKFTIGGFRVGFDWSVVIVLGLVAWSLASQVLPSGFPGHSSQAYWIAALAAAGLFLGSLLDGGRVLHAILWRLRGDRTRAALTAARVGQGVGAILIGLGVLGFVLAGNAGGLWTALVGWFVLGAARGEAQVAALRIGLGDSRVRDVMRTQPVVGPAWFTVEAFLQRFVPEHAHLPFPVQEFDGRLSGLVTLDALRRVPPERRALLRVGQVALPLERAITVTPDASAVEVVARLAMTRQTLALVLDEGRLVGVVSPTDLSRAIALGQSFPRRRGAPRRRLLAGRHRLGRRPRVARRAGAVPRFRVQALGRPDGADPASLRAPRLAGGRAGRRSGADRGRADHAGHARPRHRRDPRRPRPAVHRVRLGQATAQLVPPPLRRRPRRGPPPRHPPLPPRLHPTPVPAVTPGPPAGQRWGALRRGSTTSRTAPSSALKSATPAATRCGRLSADTDRFGRWRRGCRRAGRHLPVGGWSPSQRDGPGENVGAEMLLEHSNRRHVDRHAQCLGQFATESHEIENRVPWFQIDEKVDVADFGLFVSRDRPEYPHVRRTATAGQLDHSPPLALEKLAKASVTDDPAGHRFRLYLEFEPQAAGMKDSTKR